MNDLPVRKNRPEATARQMPLPFVMEPSFSRTAFVESASNQTALRYVERWPAWPSPSGCLFGPDGCGKTHLLTVWADRAGATVLRGDAATPERVLGQAAPIRTAVDDAHLAARDPAGAQALFHIINRANQEGGSALMAGIGHPALWETPLPDLRSRLSALHAVRMEAPDDALLMAVLAKLFADRQLRPDLDLIPYLSARIERSLTAAAALVASLDQEALETGRPIGFDMAGRLLRAAENAKA